MKRSDRELGMDRDITRRDFISGVGVAITGSSLAAGWVSLQSCGHDGSASPRLSFGLPGPQRYSGVLR
jgi:hypothetical protein